VLYRWVFNGHIPAVTVTRRFFRPVRLLQPAASTQIIAPSVRDCQTSSRAFQELCCRVRYQPFLHQNVCRVSSGHHQINVIFSITATLLVNSSFSRALSYHWKALIHACWFVHIIFYLLFWSLMFLYVFMGLAGTASSSDNANITQRRKQYCVPCLDWTKFVELI